MCDANVSADTSSLGEEGSDTHVLASVYLVESCHASSAVLKFSGTLSAQNCQDKQSATVMAFSHFVLEDTTCQYMFADIQGTHYETYLFFKILTQIQDQWTIAQLCTMS